MLRITSASDPKRRGRGGKAIHAPLEGSRRATMARLAWAWSSGNFLYSDWWSVLRKDQARLVDFMPNVICAIWSHVGSLIGAQAAQYRSVVVYLRSPHERIFPILLTPNRKAITHFPRSKVATFPSRPMGWGAPSIPSLLGQWVRPKGLGVKRSRGSRT